MSKRCFGVLAIALFIAAPVLAVDRVSSDEKGSLLIFPKVEIRWDAAGNVIQDTFLDMTNDFPGDVLVQMYFINGDPELNEPGVRIHPGCNWVDVQIALTSHQPTYWSALTGQPANGGVSPFTILDPGLPPGRPDPDGTGDRVLRGYVVAWAVDNVGREIRWNHLKGDVTIVNYLNGTAWEYNADTFAAVAGVQGGLLLAPFGQLDLNGAEYVPGFDILLLDFYAVGATAFSGPVGVIADTDVTLLPVSVDLRQEGNGGLTTKASFTIWNMNEVKLTNHDRCITCWDQALLSSYDIPNHFLLSNLQTQKGKAQIDGLASQLCNFDYDQGDGLALGADPRDIVSVAASLLGVSAKQLTFGGGVASATAGGNMVGMGTQSAQILADIIGAPPPELNGGKPLRAQPARSGMERVQE